MPKTQVKDNFTNTTFTTEITAEKKKYKQINKQKNNDKE